MQKSRSGKQVKSFLNELLMESAKFDCLPTNFESLAKLVLDPKMLIEEGAEESKIEKIAYWIYQKKYPRRIVSEPSMVRIQELQKSYSVKGFL